MNGFGCGLRDTKKHKGFGRPKWRCNSRKILPNGEDLQIMKTCLHQTQVRHTSGTCIDSHRWICHIKHHNKFTLAGQCMQGSGSLLLCRKTMVVKCIASQHASLGMLMAHLSQTGGLQGCLGVNRGTLAGNDLDKGPGWQQSRQNQTPPAVMR